MKRLAILLVLVLVPVCLFAAGNDWEGYLDVNGVYMKADMDFSYGSLTHNSTGTSAFLELAGSDYFGTVGVVYKFRFGKALTSNGHTLDDGEWGYNEAIGLSVKFDVEKEFKVFVDALFMITTDRDKDNYGTITSHLGELHFVPQARYILDSDLTLNAGVDIGFPLFCDRKGDGYYSYVDESYDVKGYRIMPFIGFGFRYAD